MNISRHNGAENLHLENVQLPIKPIAIAVTMGTELIVREKPDAVSEIFKKKLRI